MIGKLGVNNKIKRNRLKMRQHATISRGRNFAPLTLIRIERRKRMQNAGRPRVFKQKDAWNLFGALAVWRGSLRRAGVLAVILILIFSSLFVRAELQPPLAHEILYPQSCRGTWRGM